MGLTVLIYTALLLGTCVYSQSPSCNTTSEVCSSDTDCPFVQGEITQCDMQAGKCCDLTVGGLPTLCNMTLIPCQTDDGCRYLEWGYDAKCSTVAGRCCDLSDKYENTYDIGDNLREQDLDDPCPPAKPDATWDCTGLTQCDYQNPAECGTDQYCCLAGECFDRCIPDLRICVDTERIRLSILSDASCLTQLQDVQTAQTFLAFCGSLVSGLQCVSKKLMQGFHGSVYSRLCFRRMMRFIDESPNAFFDEINKNMTLLNQTFNISEGFVSKSGKCAALPGQCTTTTLQVCQTDSDCQKDIGWGNIGKCHTVAEKCCDLSDYERRRVEREQDYQCPRLQEDSPWNCTGLALCPASWSDISCGTDKYCCSAGVCRERCLPDMKMCVNTGKILQAIISNMDTCLVKIQDVLSAETFPTYCSSLVGILQCASKRLMQGFDSPVYSESCFRRMLRFFEESPTVIFDELKKVIPNQEINEDFVLKTGNCSGCPLGDQYDNCATLSCEIYAAGCCKTCAPNTTTTTATTTTTTATTTTTTTLIATTTTPTTTTTTPTTTTTTTPTTTTTTPTTTTTTPTTTTTTTPTTTTTTPTTTTTTPTTTTTTPTTTPTTPTTTTTTPTTKTTTPITTTTTPTTTTTTPTTATTTPTTTTTTTPTTTTTTTPTTTTTTTTPTTTTTTTPTTTTTTQSTTTTASTTTTTTILTTTNRRLDVRFRILTLVWIFPIRPGNTDLSDPNVQQGVSLVILTYYRRFLGPRVKSVKIKKMRSGSLIVNHEVEYEDTEEAAAEITKANIDIVGGKENIIILNETVSATSVQVNDTIITSEAVGSSETVCKLFVLSNGPCKETYSCSVEEGNPSCVLEKSQSGITVLIAVSVSLLVFLIFMYVILCLYVRAYRLRKLKHSPDSLKTDGTSIGDQRTIVRNSSISGQHDAAIGYLPYSVDKYYDRHHKHERERHSTSQDSQGCRSYISDRDRHYKHDKEHSRKHLHNYGNGNRAIDYDKDF